MLEKRAAGISLATAIVLAACGTGATASSPTTTVGPTGTPTVSDPVQPTSTPTVRATPIPRPSAEMDRAAAVSVGTEFLNRLGTGQLDEAADLVWLGASIAYEPATTREKVLAALATVCRFEFGPELAGGGNTVTWEGWLRNRPDYACPDNGLGVATRLTVENGLVVAFVPVLRSGIGP